MKFVLLFFLMPLFACAQQDFDYALYTRHAQISGLNSGNIKKLELLLERRIIKEGSILRVIPLINTGNGAEYHIQFEGFAYDSLPLQIQIFGTGGKVPFFSYVTEDQKYIIRIAPEIPLIEFYEKGKLVDTYY